MQIDENRGDGTLWIDACEAGHIDIDGQPYREPVCLNGTSVEKIGVGLPADLQFGHFQAAVAAHAEVVLVGTGDRQQFLPPRLMAQLAAHGIGLECMTTPAACRTYMILRSEGRQVWAWLWPCA